MTVLPLSLTIGDGPDKHVAQLFDGPRRRIVQITLRNGAGLARHTAPVPITIQCLAGAGTLTAGEDRQTVTLAPGVLATLDAHVPHALKADPALSILLTQFTDA